MSVPSVIYAGSSVDDWTENFSDYQAPTWDCSLVLVSDAGRFEFAATDNGAGHKFALTKTQTAPVPAGTYHWRISVTDGTDSYVVQEGVVDVRASLSDATDTRTHARKVLEAIEDVLEGRPSEADQVSIGGRSLTRMPIRDLLHFRAIYRQEVRNEEDAHRLNNGLNARNIIRVRFGTVTDS